MRKKVGSKKQASRSWPTVSSTRDNHPPKPSPYCSSSIHPTWTCHPQLFHWTSHPEKGNTPHPARAGRRQMVWHFTGSPGSTRLLQWAMRRCNTVGKTETCGCTMVQDRAWKHWDLFAGIKSLRGRSNERLRRKSKRNRVHLKASAHRCKYLCSSCCLFPINQTTYHFSQACHNYSLFKKVCLKGCKPMPLTCCSQERTRASLGGQEGTRPFGTCSACTVGTKLAGFFSGANSFCSRCSG